VLRIEAKDRVSPSGALVLDHDASSERELFHLIDIKSRALKLRRGTPACAKATASQATGISTGGKETRMGGLGPAHKSERARLARLANMAKARAARKREPLRWRSGLESRIIEQLVWQWWVESRVETRVVAAYAKASAGRPWAKQRVARLLDVSHTWVNKLVKRFEAEPDRMRRRMAACAPASFEKLEQARRRRDGSGNSAGYEARSGCGG
jgi:hypothetical protein